MQAGNEGPVQRFRHEGVLLGPEITLRRACALSRFADCRQIDERAAIGLDKVLKQAGDFRFCRGIFDVVDEAGQCQNLALA